ncbi:hypothetical protein ACFRCW_40290 [Streptomyces sp. NPDC056653]
MPTPRIGDEKTCLALRREEKATRIANSAAEIPDRCGRRRAGKTGA